MDNQRRCPECGAAWDESTRCQEHFYQMLAWEQEYPAVGAEVHHLMVLSYHLQHPSLYSPEGLEYGQSLLADFLVRGLTPAEVRRQNSAMLDSGKRKFRITARPDSYGVYAHPVTWTMTAADVTAGGVENYVDNVKAWARSILDALRASGNMPPGSNRLVNR